MTTPATGLTGLGDTGGLDFAGNFAGFGGDATFADGF
jgi:hypothetical protein